uniref:TNFR-Cys domain-containing protein n=1 Tax=Strigamia maritima TaxID=126957 RepID=T1IP87_STRMM
MWLHLLLLTILVNIRPAISFCDCPLGFECSDLEDDKLNSTCVPTVSVLCNEGLTYLSNGTCNQCSTCLSGLEERACNQTHDSVCVDRLCEREFYWNYETSRCDLCRLCPHGSGAIVPCGPSNDAICLQCPIGYFSDVLSYSAECVPCTICKNDQVVHNCTSIQDAICNAF